MSYRRRSYSRSRSPSYSPYYARARYENVLKRDPPSQCSLLIRNLPRDARTSFIESEIRYNAEKYGPVRDVYLPRDYYTGEPRGIGFVEFTSCRDAEDAKYGMDHMNFLGKEISVVFAMQGRKRPDDYNRVSNFRYHKSSRSYRRSYSRSPSRYRKRSRSRTPPRRRKYSYSRSPHRKHSDSRSPKRYLSKKSISRSRSPVRAKSEERSISPETNRRQSNKETSKSNGLENNKNPSASMSESDTGVSNSKSFSSQ